MSKAMRAANPPVPVIRMSQLAMSAPRHRRPVPAIVEPGRELVLHDALARGPLELVDEGDVARVLVGREARAKPAGQGCRIDERARAGLDEQLDVLFADIGRN